MHEDELRQVVTSALDRPGDTENWAERSGAVLYSELGSVRPGRAYLLGINPGGQEDGAPEAAIIRNLFAPQGTNSYADQCWNGCPDPYACAHCEGGRLKPAARTSIQHRVCSLFDMLGAQPADVLSTNLVFARSSQLSALRGRTAEWIRRCRDVHVALLGIVRPRWIITLGFGKAFSSVKSFGKETRSQEQILSGGQVVAWHRHVAVRLEDGDTLDVGVLGVAHPSHRGFGRVGLAGASAYPDALRSFISDHVLTTSPQ
jgi:hypothetical protein